MRAVERTCSKSLPPLWMPTTSLRMVLLLLSLLWLLLLLFQPVAGDVMEGEMCTKSAPVQRVTKKKVSVLRRVPASCSNWEKAWAWITKKDCGTKYRLDMVDVPSPKVVTYRVVKVCCEGDIQCEQAQADLKARREEAAEEQLLAIVLGSCAAVIIIVAIIVGLSLRRRKKRCMMTCEERKHVYISTEEEEETSELQTHTRYTPHGERTADSKECESQYAEIHESGLPRYADIFREEGSADPFLQATAPPISMYEARAEGFLNNGRRAKHESDSGQVSSVVGDTKNQQETQLVCGHCPHSTVTHSTAHCDRCHEHRSKDSCDQAVPSVTKDDPAVLTGAPTSSPPSPPCVPPHPPSPPCVPPPPSSAPCVRTLPPHPASASHTEGPWSCDDRCKPERPPPFSTCRDRGGAVRYETLTAPGCKDSHEYQRLSTPAAEDVQM